MYKCPKCGAEVTPGQEMCSCGMKITWPGSQNILTDQPCDDFEESYPERNTISSVISVVAAFIMIIGVLAGLLISISHGNTAGLVILFVSVITGIFMLGFAKIIDLLQDIKNRLD